MKLASWLLILLTLLASLVVAMLLLSNEGGCDRTPDDDDGEPACKPGDDTCKVDAPAPPSTPPVGPPA